jgi:hypothetical protein
LGIGKSRKVSSRAFLIGVCLVLLLAVVAPGLTSCGGNQSNSDSGNNTITYAPRLDTLDGKTIGLLSLDEWQAFRILPEVQKELQAKYPNTTFIPYTEFPMGLVNVGESSTAQAIAQKGCQGVIIANIG